MNSETIEIPVDVEFFLKAKLNYFFQRKGYGEIRFKLQEGYVQTMHITESFRAKKRMRRHDTQHTVTTSQSND